MSPAQLARLLWRSGFEVIGILGLIWLVGLFWFASTLDDGSPDPKAKTDAIVVLTGGSGRLEAGLALLRQGKAKKMFVSGVHPGIGSAHLLHDADAPDGLVRCCVVLGHMAGNTIGNALETAQWLREQHYRSIRLVTANYHMRRSLLEFRRVLPADTRIIPEPVQPATENSPWWLWRSGEKIVVVEYLKYLIAWFRPSFIDAAETTS